MTGLSGHELTESITLQLTHAQLERLDDLRSDRNLSRGQLIGELVEHAKLRQAPRRAASGRQKPNPWARSGPAAKPELSRAANNTAL